jgi:murein DD-endopeptidase MepM/ murein hydrolase activator NlpD
MAAPRKDPLTAPPRTKRILGKLKSKYRLLLINDRTFEERFSIRLTRLNVLLLALVAFTLHGLFVTALIVFTPLKRYIPGYSDQETKRNAFRSTVLADSLEQRVKEQDAYLVNLQRVLRGELQADSANLFAPLATTPGPEDLVPGEADSALRARIASEEAYDLVEGPTAGGSRDLAGVILFPPLRGIITTTYDRAQGHFGVDIVAKADAAVKACLEGTVIAASWTTDAGHVLHIQHRNDLVSVYKHNSVLLRKVGDKVRAGEAVAIVGNSGELTTGPHLHFELWLKGDPVDPQSYMVFE